MADRGSSILRPGYECEDIFVEFMRKLRDLLRVLFGVDCWQVLASSWSEEARAGHAGGEYDDVTGDTVGWVELE